MTRRNQMFWNGYGINSQLHNTATWPCMTLSTATSLGLRSLKSPCMWKKWKTYFTEYSGHVKWWAWNHFTKWECSLQRNGNQINLLYRLRMQNPNPFLRKSSWYVCVRASVRHMFSGYKPISFVWLTPAVGDTTCLFLTPFHLVLSFVLQDPNPAWLRSHI